MRSFMRGILWLFLIYLLFENYRTDQSRNALLLIFVVLLLASIKKKNRELPTIDAPIARPPQMDVFELKKDFKTELSDDQVRNIANTIAVSGALENIYPVEDEIELRLATNPRPEIQDPRLQYFGRICSDQSELTRSNNMFAVFESMLTKSYSRIHPQFMEVIISFGWIGLNMGNLPPLTLVKIEDACASEEERRIFLQRLENYKVSGDELSELANIWNSQIEMLCRYISNDAGMAAIKAREPFWLASFSAM